MRAFCRSIFSFSLALCVFARAPAVQVQALDAVETEHLMSRGGVRFGPMPSVIPRPDAEISDEQRERAAARARAKEAVMRESS